MSALSIAEKQYETSEDKWQRATHGTNDESDAVFEMINALRDMIAVQQKEIDALIAHAQRPLEMPS